MKYNYEDVKATNESNKATASGYYQYNIETFDVERNRVLATRRIDNSGLDTTVEGVVCLIITEGYYFKNLGKIKNWSGFQLQTTLSTEQIKTLKEHIYGKLCDINGYYPEVQPDENDSLTIMLEKYFYWAYTYNAEYFSEMDEATKYADYMREQWEVYCDYGQLTNNDSPAVGTLASYKSESGKYLIPVSWEVYSTITVEADNLEQAVRIAQEKIDDLPISTACEYIDGSYKIEVDTDDDAINAQDYVTISEIVIKKDGTIIN